MNILVAIIGVLMFLGISSVTGLLFYLCNLSFWVGFLIAFIVQFIINETYTKYLNKKYEKDILRLQKEISEIDLLQKVETNCEYCGQKNLANIHLNQDNYIVCSSCQNKNKIIINYYCARITEPIYAKSDVKDIFDKLDRVEERKA